MTNSNLRQNNQTLNIAPVSFSKEKIAIGRVPYEGEEVYASLRKTYRQTHAFRFDKLDGSITNVTLSPKEGPLGVVSEEDIQHNLLLMAIAIQKSIVSWLEGRREIIKDGKHISFWGARPQYLLLSKALQDINVKPIPGIEVVTRFDIDARMFWPSGNIPDPYLGILIDIKTSNVIDLSVEELVKRKVDVIGKYVCKRSEDRLEYVRPRFELIGVINQIKDGTLLLSDTEGLDEIASRKAFLEPRSENLEAVVRTLYASQANRIWSRLRELRAPLTTATGKLAQIKQTLRGLQKNCEILLGGDVQVNLGELLVSGDEQFPTQIPTNRPSLLFGPQGRKQETIPDKGIQTWGPFKYMQHTRNTPLIVIICEASNQGRVEQFVDMLRSGFPNNAKENPFQGGLIGKFRLTDIRLDYETVDKASAEGYRLASKRLLERQTSGPDLAIVQTRQAFQKLRGDANPYLVTKAAFMQAGVPVQAVRIETIDSSDQSLPSILNNVALASYAKLDGVPWVISTRNPTSHELVIGLGYTEVRRNRLDPKMRFVGITTVFQGDGRYLVWGITREVEFEQYTDALLNNLGTTIRYVKNENQWQEGDRIRLIFHVFKPLKNTEVEAIKSLVSKLIESDDQVEYAFLDVSSSHPYQIFDPQQTGKPYYSPLERKRKYKGTGVPQRGLCYQFSNNMALLHLVGPQEIKTEEHGVPQPMLVKLHPDSDFRDMPYLLRQIFHFTFMSWQSFFPASEPVTIQYSRLIARLLGNLKSVTGWDSAVLSVGNLRNRRWFL